MKVLTSLFVSGAMILLLEGSHSILRAQNPSSPAGATSVAARPKDTPGGTSSIDPVQPVITIRGACKDAAKTAAASCVTIIKREDFERLVNALTPPGSPLAENARQTLARTYAEALAFEAAAKREGLEDTVQYREALEFVRLRTVADLYRRGLQDKYRTPPQEDIDAYYKLHAGEYERVKIARILIPRENAADPDKDAFDKKALDAANAARERATQGADVGTVQQDAYTALGLKFAPPSDMGTLGRSAFIEKEAADIFALPAGGVTPVEVEPKNYVIYKVVTKETLNAEQVKPEIVRAISQQRVREAIKAVTDAAPVEFNEAYFGAGIKGPSAPAVPPRMAH